VVLAVRGGLVQISGLGDLRLHCTPTAPRDHLAEPMHERRISLLDLDQLRKWNPSSMCLNGNGKKTYAPSGFAAKARIPKRFFSRATLPPDARAFRTRSTGCGKLRRGAPVVLPFIPCELQLLLRAGWMVTCSIRPACCRCRQRVRGRTSCLRNERPPEIWCRHCSC
jgi:hypothetical protein